MNFTETELHRSIDGELSTDAAAGVAAWIAADPERRRTDSAFRLQRDLLHARFDPLLNEKIPPQLLAAAQIRKSAANQPRFRRYAAQAVFAAACVGAGWFAHTWTTRAAPSSGDTFAFLPRHAAVAHSVYVPEVRHPVEVGADQEGHLVQWLSKRLAVPVRAPGLSRLGFKLVGGRLLPGDSKPVAQFMYQNDAGKRLTLYVVALAAARNSAASESAFRFETVGNVSVFYWREDGRGYALSGDLTRAELLPMAQLVYDDLNAPGSKGG